jgi:putative endonuclease
LVCDTNFHSRFGEIDIIAKKDDILHFFEVKYSKNYDPITRITPSKLNKIIKTVNYYMYKKNIDIDYQIDALLVNDETIEVVENISY